MESIDEDHARYDHDAVTKVWEALGNPVYDGRHISEHVAVLRTENAALRAELRDVRALLDTTCKSEHDALAVVRAENAALRKVCEAAQNKVQSAIETGNGVWLEQAIELLRAALEVKNG